jgi:hypothetical protein
LTLDSVSRAWLDAAEDLRITVVAPYELAGITGGTAPSAVAWIASFGSAAGIVVARLQARQDQVRAIAQARGQAFSFISEESYARYDRDLFLATLNDWGWFGDPADAPGW